MKSINLNSSLVFFFLLFQHISFSQSELLLPLRHGEQLIFYTVDGVEKFRIDDYVFRKSFKPLDFNCFNDGLCLLKKGDHNKRNVHYIDTSGNIVFSLENGYGYPFSDGLANVYDKKNKKKGFINSKGEWVIELDQCSETYFSEGMTMIQYALEDSLGYIDKKGAIQFKKSRKNAAFSPQRIGFSNGLALYRNGLFGKGYSYLNKKGEIAFEGKYKRSQRFSEGLASLEIKPLTCGYIDTLGNLVFSIKGKKCGSFSDGLASVQHRGKWGFINPKGAWVINAKYKEVQSFKDGYTVVRKPNQWLVIDRKGLMVFEDSLANYMQYLGEEVVFVNYHGENNYAYYRLDGSLIVAPDPEYIQHTNFKVADLAPLESVGSFSVHPFYDQFNEKVWGETPYFIARDKQKMGRNSTQFPMEVLKYIHLKELDLSYNQLDKIPSEICRLGKLEALNLRDNEFKTFPKNLNCLNHLKFLDLAFNPIDTLPEEGLVFKNIERLNILHTPLAKDPTLLTKLKKHFPNAKIITRRKSDVEVTRQK